MKRPEPLQGGMTVSQLNERSDAVYDELERLEERIEELEANRPFWARPLTTRGRDVLCAKDPDDATG